MNNVIIVNHGLWESYEPENDTSTSETKYLYCRRVEDQIDFYQNRSLFTGPNLCNLTAILDGDYYIIKSSAYADVPCYPKDKYYFTVENWELSYEELLKYRIKVSDLTIEKIPLFDNIFDYVSNKRWEIETGGLYLPDQTYIPTDDRTKLLVTGARIKVDTEPTHTIRFKLNGAFVTLTSEGIVAISNAILEHTQKAFNVEDIIINKINNNEISTEEEVDLIFSSYFSGAV